ncbi:MAG TPA: glycosyltransferase [Candidatus Acidoferrum sp.]|nr:glycosyltransferase [Candidatus Acidoferrum sp.]
MKILHVPFTFGPDPVGGTEVYVQSLSRSQREIGVEPVIAAPGARTESYTIEGLTVHRFAVRDSVTDIRELYAAGDPGAARQFGRILDGEEPDVVHLHALTRGASLLLVREASMRDVPSVFTYHTPTVSCPRGTLLRWGHEQCDGRVDAVRCTECRLESLGLNRIASRVLARVPASFGRAMANHGRSGGVWTALAMRELVSIRHQTFRECMAEVRHIVAVCEWARGVLERNGVPPAKVSVSRAGVQGPAASARGRDLGPPTDETLRAVFLGRLDPTKGPDLLVKAVRSAPGLNIKLDIYGVMDAPSGNRYHAELIAAAAGDPRIVFRRPVPSAEVVALLRSYDVVMVPSRWLETGPLVVLEAFAAGTPVIGSALGGIAELVSHGVDGLLVRSSSVDAWREALERVDRERELLVTLRRGIRPPRTMADVADDMMAVYGRVLGEPEEGSRGARSAHPVRSVH